MSFTQNSILNFIAGDVSSLNSSGSGLRIKQKNSNGFKLLALIYLFMYLVQHVEQFLNSFCFVKEKLNQQQQQQKQQYQHPTKDTITMKRAEKDLTPGGSAVIRIAGHVITESDEYLTNNNHLTCSMSKTTKIPKGKQQL